MSKVIETKEELIEALGGEKRLVTIGWLRMKHLKSTAEIGDEVDLSSTTVGKRLKEIREMIPADRLPAPLRVHWVAGRSLTDKDRKARESQFKKLYKGGASLTSAAAEAKVDVSEAKALAGLDPKVSLNPGLSESVRKKFVAHAKAKGLPSAVYMAEKFGISVHSAVVELIRAGLREPPESKTQCRKVQREAKKKTQEEIRNTYGYSRAKLAKILAAPC